MEIEIDYSKLHTLVTHLCPDFDALVSTYLVKRAFPHAAIEFTPMGSRIEKEDKRHLFLHIDTGGIHHDHHHIFGYCRACFEKTGQLFLVPHDKSFENMKCPNCGVYVKDSKMGHFDRTLSSTYVVSHDNEILRRLPGSIKKSRAFKPLIEAVNLWDNAKYDTVGDGGKDLLSCELRNHSHIFKLMEGNNLHYTERTHEHARERLVYAFTVLDRLFHENRADLLVSIDGDQDKLAIDSYDAAFHKNLFEVKDGAIFRTEHGQAIMYEDFDHNPKIIYSFFEYFGYQTTKDNWTGISSAPNAAQLSLVFEAIRKRIDEKKLGGNYPGNKGEDGEVIIVAGDHIILFDPDSPSRLTNASENPKRISVNAKRFKEEMVETHGMLRLFFNSFSKDSRSYEDVWHDYKHEKKLRKVA
jgi:hypothetical protein